MKIHLEEMGGNFRLHPRLNKINNYQPNESTEKYSYKQSSFKQNNSIDTDPIFKPIMKERVVTQLYPIPLQYQWLLNTSARFDFHKNSSALKVGPGSYNNLAPNKSSVYTFGKYERFKNQEPETGKIGPGNYNLPKQQSIGGAKINRSPQKINRTEIVSNEIKYSTPGPGSYHNQSPIKSKEKQSTSVEFKSKINRFKVSQNPHLGPGVYNQEGQFDQVLKRLHIKKHYQSHMKAYKSTFQSPKKKKVQKKSPGPGAYENQKSLTKYLKKKFDNGYKGDFGSKQNRFADQKISTIQTPGPGHYMKSKNRVQLQSLSPPKPTSSFANSPKLGIFKQQQSPFGAYDLSSLTISYSVQKKKQQIEHLKSIDVSIPGFGSGVTRNYQQSI